MNRLPSLTRRQFVTSVAATAALAKASASSLLARETPRFKIIAFSKPFASMKFDETAELIAEVGWDGIECAVRSKEAHIAPERVQDDLPKMVEALKKRGKELTILCTDITEIDATAEKVLRTAAQLGIKKYRLGVRKYTKDKTVPETIREVGSKLKDLAALNRELGLQGGWQNHSGADYVGAPIWDIWTMIKDLDPKAMGICFDIGHATLEGGKSWPVQARLMEPFFVSVFVKDFRWEKTDKGWQPLWCNLGEGTVQKSFLTNLKKTSFAGPICQHHEYKTLGTGKDMVANFKKDLAKLREWLG